MSNEDWEALEKILYDLSILGDGARGEHTPLDQDRRIIGETLLRIPESIREKVVEEATFITIGGACGCVLPMTFSEVKSEEQLNRWGDGQVRVEIEVLLILINFAEMEKEEMDEEGMRTTVAHEIAHFILEHHKSSSGSSPEVEKEADDLIAEWGFKRAYQSYECFANS
jgi:hypothetical protein